MVAGQGGTVSRPWRLPDGIRYGLTRLKGMLRPAVTLYEPDAGSLLVERDVEVSMRDGTVLRVNVHRPPGGEPAPVLMSAHPYGKDRVPGPRARIPLQYRLMRQPGTIRHSTLTSWEAPDPAWWVSRGYVVINADVRGAGTSDGVCQPFSDQEARDTYDLIEWAAAQPWSSGRVGLLGVSYLAISQYKPAALHPPSLRAICPWEGMTDPYRDLMRPGGLQEDGFVRLWAAGIRRRTRATTDLRVAQREHALRDGWWQSLTPELGKIEVPMLVCASFSDNNVHSRGSFRAFQLAGSAEKFAYTHRDGKWRVFYSDRALEVQLAFFDRFLRESTAAPPPRIRLEVREDRDRVVAVRDETDWPLPGTRWRPLHLHPDGRLADTTPSQPGRTTFDTRRAGAAFAFTTPEGLELTGPMSARLWLEVEGDDDVELCLGVEKWRGRHYVGFEGAYGWGRDRVATGWQKASLRELDAARSAVGEPVHTFANPQPLVPGQIVPLDIALGPSATLFRAGETLRLVVAGRWLSTRNPLTGQFPAHYRSRPGARCTLHWGPDRPAHLLVPARDADR